MKQQKNLTGLSLYLSVLSQEDYLAKQRKTVTPFSKTFWSKRFWTGKPTWNLFKKEFWSVKKENLEKLYYQVSNTRRVAESLENYLTSFKHSNKVDVKVEQISSFGPSRILVLPRDDEGQALVNSLKEALNNAKVPRFDRKKHIKTAMNELGSLDVY